jgi:hypothetical protein
MNPEKSKQEKSLTWTLVILVIVVFGFYFGYILMNWLR